MAPDPLARGPIPLYYQIAWQLRRGIHARQYEPHARLPTEEELVRTFGVSRTTVRLAFQVLLKDGLVRRMAGRGTFVSADPGRHPVEWMVESVDDVITSPTRLRHRYRFVDIRDVPASRELAALFGGPPGMPVTEFRRLRLVDGRPFFHVTLQVPRGLAERVPRARLRDKPMVSLLEEHAGIRVVAADQWASAERADGDVVRHLRVKPGDPILSVERHFFDERGRVVEIAVDRYRTDGVRYYLRLRRRSRAAEAGARPEAASLGRRVAGLAGLLDVAALPDHRRG
jgi:GntR family transcriptional regulator